MLSIKIKIKHKITVVELWGEGDGENDKCIIKATTSCHRWSLRQSKLGKIRKKCIRKIKASKFEKELKEPW